MMLDFSKMGPVKKMYWKIRLWFMDHRITLEETHWQILEPSYYYIHTAEECEREKQRRRDELLAIINETSEEPVIERV